MAEPIANPILNSPYEQPDRYFEIGSTGRTGEVLHGRRPSESFIPIAPTRKGQQIANGMTATQDTIDVDVTGERRERNSLINDLRREVGQWRHGGYNQATAITRKLLQHWADPTREDRVLFCQREAAETAIFLAEVAGRHGYRDWRRQLEPENAIHNDGLPRVAVKMATGTGKTVVMAMLIAWQTLNKVQTPRDARFTNRFLVVTPGITIRDRLRVLRPGDPGNYYDERDLIPPDLAGQLAQAQIVITNFHAFLAKDAKEIRGAAKNTRKLLNPGGKRDPFVETPEAMVSRVLRDFTGSGTGSGTGTGGTRQQLVVLNDEAHHCYRDRPIQADATTPKLSKEQRDDNEQARVWFRGLRAVATHARIKTVYDLSATPYYLTGSGYTEGFIFPWTVSDFSLMDAIESGIVKIPRTPVDDDAQHDLVTYLRLWDFVGDDLPKKKRAEYAGSTDWVPPPELEGALRSLHRSYRRSFEHWQAHLAEHGEPPPVFIVVCANTVVSKLVYDWLAGREVERADGTVVHRPGELDLLTNVVDGRPLTRPRTILVDSAQLESGEVLKADFKAAAAEEIAAFQAEYRRGNPSADAETISDEQLLREVMNTVGKKGRLGEGIRCVVSVGMLTEGWDANTVTHILGVRAFRSQLLCEQVVGRGLRRRSYAVNDDGRFEPEYASVYGIPFAFIPTDKAAPEALPSPPAHEVAAIEGREDYRICFPKLEGYRVELPDEELSFDPDAAQPFVIGGSTVPRWTESQGVVGEAERDEDRDPLTFRAQQVTYKLAAQLLEQHFHATPQDRRPWLFPRLVRIARQWLDTQVEVHDGFAVGYLLTNAERRAEAVEAIHHAIVRQTGNRRERLRPMLRRFDPTGSTADVHFYTRKGVVEATRSEVSHVTLDGKDKMNTWEYILALECELHSAVAAYVKNDHLGFTIPYIHKGRTHSYVPDFLIRLNRAEGEDVDRILIVEVSGGQKSPGPTAVKARTARDSWCVAVNNHGGFGRWGYVEITSMVGIRERLAEAIQGLCSDAPLTGDPDLLDYAETAGAAPTTSEEVAGGA